MKTYKKTPLYYNEDCSNFFVHFELEASLCREKTEQAINSYIDTVADSGVDIFLQNTNARRTNYKSGVWKSFWEGVLDETGCFSCVSKMYKIHQLGIDYPAYVIERCRYRGMSPWISLRMNDCHDNDELHRSSFWGKNPQYARNGVNGYFASCLDYAHLEVRDYFMALIEETLNRYDIDGLELDFMREPYLFSKGKEREGAIILNQWLIKIRNLMNKAAQERGHKIKLGIRVPSHPSTALSLGLDVPCWLKNNLIDVLVVTPRWASIEYNIPIWQWREMLGESKTALIGGIEALYKTHIGGMNIAVSPEQALGGATTILANGADGVYLFNYFHNHDFASWPISVYKQTLRAMTSLDTLLKSSRRIGLTFRDVTAPDEDYQSQLPQSGREVELYLNLGPVADADQCHLLVDVGDNCQPPEAFVNGHKCNYSGININNHNHLFELEIPACAIKEKCPQKIELLPNDVEFLTVVNVEIAISPAQK